MTRRLILIRHAKSGWDDPFADDHARVLTPRGKQAASLIGGWLAEYGWSPDVVLSSDAARTRETTALLVAELTPAPAVTWVPALYHAAPDTVAEIACKSPAQTLAIVGHNPGIGMLAARLVTKRPAHRRFDDYPTCATTVLEFDEAKWLTPHAGRVLGFAVPRDLADLDEA